VHYALDRNNSNPEAVIVRYHIDPRASTFHVRAFATGMLSAFAHSPTIAIRDYSGEAQISPDALDSASLQLHIKATSLTVADDISDKDRGEIERQMYADVLEVSKFPEIVYDCERVSISKAPNGNLEITLDGELTLHGVTQSQPVKGRVMLIGDSLRASGEFAVSLSAYGIKPVSAVGGTIRLKDELKGTFEILARKQV
jgi:polyisoprenoid-binding protein YceI